MKLRRYWGNGSPSVVVAGLATATWDEFKAHYGCSTGHKTRQGLAIFTGHAAIEFLKFIGEPLGEYEGWVPKNDSRKFHRLPDSFFVECAKSYTLRNDWKREENGAYQHVHKHRQHLIPACTAHMVREGEPFGKGYQVYVYEFSDKSVYVGLTCNPTRRHKDHIKRGPVARKLAGGTPHEVKSVAEGLMPTPAGELEQATLNRYADEGWTLLNRHDAGSTGQIRTKYTLDRLRQIACGASSRKGFQLLDNGAYQYACTNGHMGALAVEFGWPDHAGHVWTFELCRDEARKFKWLSDWVAGHTASYTAAWKNGWLTRIKKELFPRAKPVEVKWTREACLERAKAFSTRGQWQYEAGDGSYIAARRKGWLPEIAALVFGPRRQRWSPPVPV